LRQRDGHAPLAVRLRVALGARLHALVNGHVEGGQVAQVGRARKSETAGSVDGCVPAIRQGLKRPLKEEHTMRKMRIIVALAAAFALAIPAVASADAFVDSQGYGFVGKGDVQTTLGLNDGELQTLFASDYPPQFGVRVVTTYDNYWACSDGSVRPYTTTVTSNQSVNSIANTNNAGKLTAGWELTGLRGTAHSSSVDNLPEGTYPAGWELTYPLVCPHGTVLTDQRVNDDGYSTTTSTPYVNGILMANTPAEVTS
jgi:hypothetical protein